jgi:hypothetical protein
MHHDRFARSHGSGVGKQGIYIGDIVGGKCKKSICGSIFPNVGALGRKTNCVASRMPSERDVDWWQS